MITVLVLVSLIALAGFCAPGLLRPSPWRTDDPPPCGDPPHVHPESMTAELDPGDEEYLAFLANELWPEDEYLEPEHSTDGEEESGGSGMRL